ncbi:protein kinase family protein [Cellulomonas edaphi]|uniref:Protein kinase domain-containing protein n=1 Tax=Cellulomonas edaphi TaxID=3053468 RepID=A0ABT7S7E8_9CELL|nr:hypothetical protein [Cellulomons edaphi]MDM7831444.1 hypothetical protein [Cellulomons edaphi]
MDVLPVPPDVARALDGLDLVPVAPAGPEGGGWLAAARQEPSRYVELHVLPGSLDDELARRLDVLRTVRHPHLVRLLDAVAIGSGQIGLLVEHVPGLTVAEMRSSRAPLSDGEGVTLVVPVLEALAALHRAGLVHGPVTASSVVVRPDGRPVLVDLRGAVLGAGTADGDLRRWLATVVAQLPPAEARRPPARPGPRPLRALLEAALRADLDVDELVRRCFAVAEPEPLRLPDPGVLAGADLVRASRRHPVRPQRRLPHAPRAWLLALVGAVVLAAGIGTLVHRTDGSAAAAERPDPVAAAVSLSAARARAVADGDARGLAAVEVPGGPAHRADLALLDALDGQKVDGLGIDVVSAAAVSGGGDAARVALRSAVTAHVVVAEDGARRRVAAGPERDVVLDLRWTPGGWRVWEVRPG